MRRARVWVFGLLVSVVSLVPSAAWAAPEDICWIYTWPHC